MIDTQKLMLEIVDAILSEKSDILLQKKINSWNKGMQYLKKEQPDILLIDVFQYVNSLERLSFLRKEFPKMKIIVFTFCKDQALIVRAVNIGIEGYVAKDSDYEHIAQSIEAVYHGGDYFFPPISDLMKEDMKYVRQALYQSKRIQDLTKRQREVMSLIAKGYSNLQIAEELNISDKTVKNHVSALLRKMNFNDRTQAAVFFLNHKMN